MSSTNPSPPKSLLLFAAHGLVLALLIGFWPSARALYPPLLRAQGSALFASAQNGSLVIRPAPEGPAGGLDTFIESYAPGAREAEWRIGLSAVRMGYWPSAVLVALLLATPMPARRRWIAAGLGLLWLDVFVLGRVGLEILRAFEELERGGVRAVAGSSLLLYRTVSRVANSNIVVIASVLLGWVVLARPRQVLELGGLDRWIGISRPQ